MHYRCAVSGGIYGSHYLTDQWQAVCGLGIEGLIKEIGYGSAQLRVKATLNKTKQMCVVLAAR